MPSNKDPALISTGHGTALEDSVAESSLNFEFAGGTQAALEAHIIDPLDAHDGDSVSIPASLPYTSDTVTGALTELAGVAFPPAPDVMGENESDIPNTGFPDWGLLRTASESQPSWAISPLQTKDSVTGAFTDGGAFVPTEFVTTGVAVSISGMIYPADRGVLALYENGVAVAATNLAGIFYEDDTAVAPGPAPFPPFPSRATGQANYGPVLGEGTPYYSGGLTEGLVAALPQIDILNRLPVLRDNVGLDAVPVAERGRYDPSARLYEDYDHDNGSHQVALFVVPHTLAAGKSTLQLAHFETVADFTAGLGVGATFSVSTKFADESGNGNSTISSTTFARSAPTGSPDFRTLELPAFLRISTGDDRGVYEIDSITDADTLEVTEAFVKGDTLADWDIVSPGYLSTIRENVYKDTGVTAPTITTLTTASGSPTATRDVSGVSYYDDTTGFTTTAIASNVFNDSYLIGNEAASDDPPEIQLGYLTDPPLEIDYSTGWGRTDDTANWDEFGHTLGAPPASGATATYAETDAVFGTTEKFSRNAQTQATFKKTTGDSPLATQTGDSVLVNLTTDYGSVTTARETSETFIDDETRVEHEGAAMAALTYFHKDTTGGTTISTSTFTDSGSADFTLLSLPAKLRILGGPDQGLFNIVSIGGTSTLIVGGAFTSTTGSLAYEIIGPAPGVAAAVSPAWPGTFTPSTLLTDASRDYELQVLGAPALNTDLGRGRVEYPQNDYTTGHDPAGPDYSAISPSEDSAWARHHVRAFDTGAALRTGTLTISGVDLATSAQNFGFNSSFGGTGPCFFDVGHDDGARISVMVPGKTNWLDLGRPYGSPDTSMIHEGRGVLTTFDEVAGTYSYDLGAGNETFDNGSGKYVLLVRVTLFNTVDGKLASVSGIDWSP